MQPTPLSALSRRGFFRLAAGTALIAGVPIISEQQLARADQPKFADSHKGIHIDANENPLGPCEAARKAVIDNLGWSGRYQMELEKSLMQTISAIEGVDAEWIFCFAGSSGPLHMAVLANSSPSKPIVTADPGYEAPIWAAEISGAKVIKVPLLDPKGAASHDCRKMATAATNPGVIYICNPNNPTGTVTPRAEIENLLATTPKSTLVIVDEAYLHLSNAPTVIDLVKTHSNLLVLRTFSKLYGMAGLRLGYAVGQPELLKPMHKMGGLNALPTPAAVAGLASLKDKDLIPTRRALNARLRTETINWLQSEGYACTPSESNCFLLDVKRPGRQVIAALAAKDMFIGRIWPAWPTHVRITVGTETEMATFRKLFAEVMSKSTAGLVMPQMPGRLHGMPGPHFS